ncbi:MAG TPA: plastocyanin/azurin family copper-binding protein [Fodinibius sp.]|nr:plastocyanin/azurin family copper-binding protein [Fodinibius sp.]
MRYLTFLLPLVFFITSCGGGGSDNQQQADQSQDTQAATEQSGNDDVRTIEIIGVDQMKFVVKDDSQEGVVAGEKVGDMLLLETITAKPGEKIHVKLTTKSKLPAAAMSHNFLLLKRDANAEAIDKAAAQARDNDYIPSDMTDQILAHTDLAGGGETVEVTFTAPDSAGENEFMCSFPGHFASGMKGTLKVE